MSTYRCEVCDYAYNDAKGEPRDGFPAATPWTKVPDERFCPNCGVRDKVDFVALDDHTAPE